MSSLTKIANGLLSIKQIDNGVAYAQKVYNKNEIIDKDGKVYVGITDTKGNYFYLLDSRSTTYTKLGGNNCRNRYQARRNVVAVFVVKKLELELFVPIIISTISNNGGLITSSNTDSSSVYQNQTGDDSPRIDFNYWSIFSISFSVNDVVNSIERCITDEICKC